MSNPFMLRGLEDWGGGGYKINVSPDGFAGGNYCTPADNIFPLKQITAVIELMLTFYLRGK